MQEMQWHNQTNKQELQRECVGKTKKLVCPECTNRALTTNGYYVVQNENRSMYQKVHKRAKKKRKGDQAVGIAHTTKASERCEEGGRRGEEEREEEGEGKRKGRGIGRGGEEEGKGGE